MANYNNLKTAIQDVIKANGNQEITGEIMQNALLSMINSLGAGYQFVSVATPETNPGTPDQKVFYIANGKGTYVNFGGLVVDEDEVVLLVYDDAWKKLLSGIASNSKLTELGQKVVNNYWVGNGNTFAKTKIVGLRPGATYRIYLRKIPWDMTGVTVTGVTKLAIQHFYNGSQTTDLLQVQITATLRPYYDFTIPANSDYIAVGGRAAIGEIVDWNIVDLTLIKQKADLVPYFSALSIPQFLDVDLSIPTLKVKFPVNSMRLYDSFGASLIGDYTGAAKQTFTLANLQSLVWDFADSSVKVIGTGTAGDYVHLLNLAKNSVTGLFAGWFNEQKWKENDPAIVAQKSANTLGEAISASKDFAITSGMSGFSAQVDVGVPYNRKFIFRVDDPSGAITKVSTLAGYDYEGNNVDIAAINLLPNTEYVYYAPVGLQSLRVWVGASYMTGTAGTISVQVSVPSQYDDESIVRRWNDSDKLVVRDNVLKDSDFKALFFSDIHGFTAELARIIALGNDWKSLLDCIIDTGDDTASYQSASPLTWYNDLARTSELPIVRAVGNHDAWTTGYGVWGNAEQVYNFFTKPAVELMQSKGASVVQPSDAATAYRNYYYVDFGSLRMVVITSLTGGGYYDSDQATWFASVLDDARTNDKSVICLNHAPMPIISAVENVECNWCSYKIRVSDGTIMEQDPLDKVDAFIRAGGKFVCWFTGHTHIDYVVKFSKTIDGVTKTQFCFTTSTASQAGPIDAVRQKSNRDNGFDLFNMVGIDLTNHLVKIWRIGLNTNHYLQLHNTFVWDYVNNRIVSD